MKIDCEERVIRVSCHCCYFQECDTLEELSFDSLDQPLVKSLFGYKTHHGKVMFGYWDQLVKSLLGSWVHPVEKLYFGLGDNSV